MDLGEQWKHFYLVAFAPAFISAWQGGARRDEAAAQGGPQATN
jgi:hypothetical protein